MSSSKWQRLYETSQVIAGDDELSIMLSKYHVDSQTVSEEKMDVRRIR